MYQWRRSLLLVRICCLTLLPALLAGVISAQTRTIGFIPSNEEPYAFEDGNRLKAGIIKDIGDGLGKHLKITVDYYFSTRKRLERDIETGKIDMISIFNPNWIDRPEVYSWSPPLFQEQNIFVVSTDRAFDVSTLRDLKGKRIGTILGYIYPTLQSTFDKGIAVRDDAKNLEQNFEKLRSGRIDALCDSNLLISYQLRNSTNEFKTLDYVVSSQDIYFCYAKRLSIPAETINKAFQAMKDSGEIERILRRYR